MRLISLEISNFRVIRNVRLTFPDRVIGIIGRNGAGKSSLVEAISWALYGNQAARTGRDEIKSIYAGVHENCEVALEFAVNEEKYKVIRRLVGKTERAEVELYRGDTSESVGVNETKAYVGQLLGLDWRGFLSSFLARQAELNALSDLQPSKRRDHIAGMLGIERLDKAIQKVKEDIRLYKEKSTFLERQLLEKDQVEKRIVELREKLTALTGPLEKQKRQLEEIEKRLGDSKASYESMQRSREEWLGVRAAIESEQKTLDSLKDQIESLRQEKTVLERNQSELDKLASMLTELKPVQDEFDRLKEARNKVALSQQLTKRKLELGKKVSSDQANLKTVESKLVGLDKELSSLPEDIADRHETEQKNLETARDEYSNLKARLDASRKEEEKLKAQVGDVESLGPDSVCDRCHRRYGDDYAQIKGHLQQELEDTRAVSLKLEAELSDKKEAGEKLRGSVAELERRKNERYRLSVERQSLAKEKDSLTKDLDDNRKALREAVDQLEQFGSVTFDQKAFDTISVKLDELRRAKERHDHLKGGLARFPVVDRSIQDLSEKVEKIGQARKDLEQTLAAIGFDEKTFEKAGTEFNRIQHEVEQARKEHLTAVKEKELVEKELEGKLEQMQGFEAAQTELEDSRSGHYYGEKLARLFADFRQDLIASIRPALAEISSRLFSEMTDGRYSLVELDEKYNLRVMDSGVYYGVDRFSGGEKDLANLCLRLAISLALTESAGLTRSFVILDEVFGSQDEQRKELIIGAMSGLKQRFPQIILITHVDDVKDGVEEIIEVVPTGNGWSEVRVNGAAVG